MKKFKPDWPALSGGDLKAGAVFVASFLNQNLANILSGLFLLFQSNLICTKDLCEQFLDVVNTLLPDLVLNGVSILSFDFSLYQ